MELPFTVDQFFEVFRSYNRGVWPAPLVLVGLAVASVVLVFLPRSWSDRAIAGVLAALWAWIGLAYHLAFFAEINPAAYGFAAASLLGSAIFLWQGVVHDRLRFRWKGDLWSWIGAAMVLFALLVYPAWCWLDGHRYPAMPTFGLPCPTTIFTLGLLALLVRPHPRSPFVVPVLWCLVGGQAALLLGVTTDLVLFLAAFVGAVLAIRARAALVAGSTKDSAAG